MTREEDAILECLFNDIAAFVDQKLAAELDDYYINGYYCSQSKEDI